jgi:hypothetical protein
MGGKSRPFNLGDLMILIAAVGVATMAVRSLLQGLTTDPGAYYWEVTPARLLIAATMAAMATPMTFACLALRLRRPRPPWRRVALEPGTAVLVVCSVLFAFRVVEVAIALGSPKVNFLAGTSVSTIPFGESLSLVVMPSSLGNGLLRHIEPIGCFGIVTTSFVSPCGPAVAAVWLFLALAGRWPRARSWIDGLGRLLGAIWIAISLLAIYPVTR